jgi:hypothetical protein
VEADTLDVDDDGIVGEISRELAYLYALQAAADIDKLSKRSKKMKEIDTQKKYHDEIIKVWEMGKAVQDGEFKGIFKRGAFAQDKLYTNSLLFLGICASYDEKKTRTCVLADSVQYETEAGRKEYDYYQKMELLAKKTGFAGWSNIDITLFHEPKQEKIVPFFGKFPEIMQAQFDLAKKMIIDIKPEIIMVSNAFVREVLRNKVAKKAGFDSGFAFDDDESGETIQKYGTPLLTAPEQLKGVPIFFTGMLNGRGVLDNGSFARLVWHIKYVKEKLQ